MTIKHILPAILLSSALLTSYAEEATQKKDAFTPQEIVEAALYGKLETIEKAQAHGYKPDTRDAEDRTALMYAAFNGHAKVVQALIAAGTDINAQDPIGTSPLMFAASGPSPETVQLLINAGAQINMVDNTEHFSALMWAAAEGQVENVKLLLKHNADITLKDVDGDTAESFAAKAGHTAIVEVLQAAAEEKGAKQKVATPKE